MSTYSSKLEQFAALRAPLAQELIMTREQSGVTLYYYSMPTIMNRLFDILGPIDIETLWYEYSKDETGKATRVDMAVRLTATFMDGSKSSVVGIGSSDIAYSKMNPYKVVNDFFKNCLSDAVKTGAMRWGVGLCLYDKEYLQTLGTPEEAPKPRKPRPEPKPEAETPSDAPEAPKAGSGLSRFKTKKAANNE